MVVALMTMTIGATSRLSTYMLVQFPFGRLGGRIVSFLLSITLFGWFGVTLMLFAQACRQTVIEIFGVDWQLASFTLAGSVLMVGTTIFGFRAIERLARVAVPLLAVLLIVGVYQVLTDSSLLESAAGPVVGDHEPRLVPLRRGLHLGLLDDRLGQDQLEEPLVEEGVVFGPGLGPDVPQ